MQISWQIVPVCFNPLLSLSLFHALSLTAAVALAEKFFICSLPPQLSVVLIQVLSAAWFTAKASKLKMLMAVADQQTILLFSYLFNIICFFFIYLDLLLFRLLLICIFICC